MRATTLVSLVVMAAFISAARGVGNLYPVSQFPMYAGSAGPAATHVMVLRAGATEYEEVDAFQSFACESLPVLEAQRCGDASAIPYLAREAEALIRSRSGAGGGEVELVLRVWSFDGVARPAHCVVARCRAVPQ